MAWNHNGDVSTKTHGNRTPFNVAISRDDGEMPHLLLVQTVPESGVPQLHLMESRTGETNASVGVSGLNWNQNGLRLVKVTADGAELDKETGSFVVRADGRTVVKLFYDRNEVTLTFDSKGGSAVSPIRKGYGLRITMPAAPTKAGYTFAGWYTDAACSAGREFAGRVMPDQDTTVYAKWTAGEYGITYVLNGGEKAEGSPDAFTYGTETVIPDPVRTGYDFAGWLVNGGETAQTGLTLGATEYSAPITLTATWTAHAACMHRPPPRWPNCPTLRD